MGILSFYIILLFVIYANYKIIEYKNKNFIVCVKYMNFDFDMSDQAYYEEDPDELYYHYSTNLEEFVPNNEGMTGLVNQLYNLRQLITQGDSYIPHFYEILMNNLNDLADERNEEPMTLSNDEFEKLENKTILSSDECNICLVNYEENPECTVTKCNHIFHTECLRQWLCNQNASCPKCRVSQK